jgi:hypothetical protein
MPKEVGLRRRRFLAAAAMTIAAAHFNGARSAKARSEFQARDLQDFKSNAIVSPISSSNFLVLALLYLCIRHIRSNSACANEHSPGGRYGSNQCYCSARPRRGCKLLAAELEATRRTPPSDPDTGPCGRRRVLCREYFGRRSDGPVVSGSQPNEMAPGSYHMVFRDDRAASLPQEPQTLSG